MIDNYERNELSIANCQLFMSIVNYKDMEVPLMILTISVR